MAYVALAAYELMCCRAMLRDALMGEASWAAWESSYPS